MPKRQEAPVVVSTVVKEREGGAAEGRLEEEEEEDPWSMKSSRFFWSDTGCASKTVMVLRISARTLRRPMPAATTSGSGRGISTHNARFCDLRMRVLGRPILIGRGEMEEGSWRRSGCDALSSEKEEGDPEGQRWISIVSIMGPAEGEESWRVAERM